MVIFGIQILVHLAPEHLSCTSIIGIIETILITRTYPVVDIIRRTLDVHPALGIELLVIIGVAIELRPYADHESSMHLVNIVQHLLGIRIARSLKLMASPLVLGPVVPVLHDIIDRNMALAELSEGALDFILSLIALTTLPEAQHPLGIKRRLTRECTIARDNLIEILTSDEVVVHILSHLAPHAQLLALSLVAWLRNSQSAISLTTIGAPLYAQLHLLTLLQFGRELIGIGVPSCTPTLRHHLFTIDIHLYIT